MPVRTAGTASVVRCAVVIAFRYQVELSASDANPGYRSLLMVPSVFSKGKRGASSRTINSTLTSDCEISAAACVAEVGAA